MLFNWNSDFWSEQGKQARFPTINLNYVSGVEFGVYASKIEINQITYNSITNVGPAVSFGEHIPKIETFVFDFNGSVYNQPVVLYLVEKIREIRKFDHPQELVRQIQQEITQAKSILAKL
jgi:FAD synthase